MVCTTTPLLPYQTTHSLSELCETFFEKSGWTGEYTTDIEGLRSGLEEVYTLALADISWEELEQLCSDTNVDSVTPSPLTALYPDAVVPRIRIPSGAASSEVVQRAQAIHRLVAHDMERPLVPRSGDRVFEEATNAQLRASLRLCGNFPQFEYYSKRDVLVALYIKAPMVLSNVTQCEYLGNQASWLNAEIGESTLLTDGGPYRFYPDCLRYGDDVPATPVAETPEQRVAKLEQLLQASQDEAAQLRANAAVVGSPVAPTPTPTPIPTPFSTPAPMPSAAAPAMARGTPMTRGLVGLTGRAVPVVPPVGLSAPASLGGGAHWGFVPSVGDTLGAAGEGATGEEQCAAAACTHQCLPRHHECRSADCFEGCRE